LAISTPASRAPGLHRLPGLPGRRPALRFKPATRVENACATGSAAVHQGIHADRGQEGEARFVLVVGVEKMTALGGKEIGETC
jgi:acetyl-CoA acetyltransferase